MNGRLVLGRSLLAGLSGTSAMALTTRTQSKLVHRIGPIDYDDSLVLVNVLDRWTGHPLPGRTRVVFNQLMRFGYGSGAGLIRNALEGRVRRPAVALFSIMWGSEVVLLRMFGVAPMPWRWKPDVLATSLVQHAVYAGVADAVYRATGRIGHGKLTAVDLRGPTP